LLVIVCVLIQFKYLNVSETFRYQSVSLEALLKASSVKRL